MNSELSKISNLRTSITSSPVVYVNFIIITFFSIKIVTEQL
jgi:hypothetical protein